MAAAKKKNSKSHPPESGPGPMNLFLEQFAHKVTAWVGGKWAFGMACAVVLAWVVTGPFFGFSDTWQLVINTGTTIVTFLMVFLIQRAQNNDSRAIQLKLNELVAALDGASNRLIGVESLSEGDLEILGRHYESLIEKASSDMTMTESHSVEEAESRHDQKVRARRGARRKSGSS